MTGLRFIRLTPENVPALSALRVAQDEAHLLTDNPSWVVQALARVESSTYGVFAGGAPVGLISLIDPANATDPDDAGHFRTDCLYVWRVMIDHRHKRQGYGSQVIGFAQDYARAVGLAGVSLTTKDQEAGNALAFYHKLGFSETGRRLLGEVELIWRP